MFLKQKYLWSMSLFKMAHNIGIYAIATFQGGFFMTFFVSTEFSGQEVGKIWAYKLLIINLYGKVGGHKVGKKWAENTLIAKTL